MTTAMMRCGVLSRQAHAHAAERYPERWI